jgi:hypothetical protein
MSELMPCELTQTHGLYMKSWLGRLGDSLKISWDIYIVDMCTATGFMYDTGFHLDEIDCPLPIPPERQELVSVTWFLLTYQ